MEWLEVAGRRAKTGGAAVRVEISTLGASIPLLAGLARMSQGQSTERAGQLYLGRFDKEDSLYFTHEHATPALYPPQNLYRRADHHPRCRALLYSPMGS